MVKIEILEVIIEKKETYQFLNCMMPWHLSTNYN